MEENHPDLSSLISDMWETCTQQMAWVGSASNWVVIELFVADGSPFGEGEDGDAGCRGFKRVMINPVLFDFSEEEDVMDEGCLTFQVREPVTRPIRLGVEYYDEDWDLVEEELKELRHASCNMKMITSTG